MKTLLDIFHDIASARDADATKLLKLQIESYFDSVLKLIVETGHISHLGSRDANASKFFYLTPQWKTYPQTNPKIKSNPNPNTTIIRQSLYIL